MLAKLFKKAKPNKFADAADDIVIAANTRWMFTTKHEQLMPSSQILLNGRLDCLIDHLRNSTPEAFRFARGCMLIRACPRTS
jgi:hypothetical protein